ncbi:MAG TPA: FAD-linked oxidase C-terminal domain-containing protein [Candidatus Acidoferrales bacterium]|nr:FAD-linked oxidase C-terminal domain-containing protein [Candidatus Acidoferrales bacterium]
MATPPAPGALTARLIEALGADSVKISPEDLRVYGFDASYEGEPPWAAVFPTDARGVSAVVRIAAEYGTAVVPRGAGTGLCGGCVPVGGSVVLSFARMNRLLHLDTLNRRARVQPGLINLDLSRAARPLGLFYAPDPSSQATCTLGGNVATNAGGPHCLSYGTTVNHVLGLEFVDHRGEVVQTDVDDAGYDLTGALVGSEGTLALVTAIDLRLLRLPPAVRVALASFADIESASAAVSAIIAAGIVPTALEIMDALVVHAVEAHYHAGFPSDAGAVLLIEVAGATEDVEEREASLAVIAREHGARSWRTARDEDERQSLWASRKGAAGALGRIAPNYYIQDATVPRTKLPQAIHAVNAIAHDYGIKVGNVFHAGDGNLHPLMTFDRRIPREVEAIAQAGTEILKACIALGGTISGEHGIGFEKRETLGLVFSAADLAAMARLRDVFDPRRLFNPEKIFPGGARCGEVRRETIARNGGAAGAWL